jgi:hypothetical protein
LGGSHQPAERSQYSKRAYPIKIPRASPRTRHTVYACRLLCRTGNPDPACSCSCNPYEVTRAVPCPFDLRPSNQGERVMSVLLTDCKCRSYLQVVASHTCNRSVLPCFEAFELSQGATNVVAWYSTAVECADDPYRCCTAWGFWMCGARDDDERKTRVWGREKGIPNTTAHSRQRDEDAVALQCNTMVSGLSIQLLDLDKRPYGQACIYTDVSTTYIHSKMKFVAVKCARRASAL